MGFLQRERKAVNFIGRGISRGLLGLWTAAVGGPTRRRGLLAVIVLGGIIGYVGFGWGVDRLLSDLLSLVFGIPAPGQPLKPTTWMSPQNGIWPDIIALSIVFWGISVLMLLALTARATTANDKHIMWQELRRVGRAWLMVVATWILLPFALHLADQIATALAPTPETLLDTPWGTTGGILVLVGVSIVQPLLVVVAIIAMAILRAVILLGFVFWPLAWPLRIVDHDFAHRFGKSITALFTVAVVTKLFQSILAFGMVALTGMIESVLIKALVFIGGTVAVFVVFPLKMLQYADRVMMLPGSIAPSERQVGRYVSESSKRVGQVHRQLDSGVERAREWREPDEAREAVQTRFKDWNDAFSEDSTSRWSGWIRHKLSFPSMSSSTSEWSQPSQSSVAHADGTYGPTSEDPDEDIPPGRDTDSPRDQARRDRL